MIIATKHQVPGTMEQSNGDSEAEGAGQTAKELWKNNQSLTDALL